MQEKKSVEYFLSLSVNEDAMHKIKLLKAKLHATIRISKSNLESIPHISLLSFLMAENDTSVISMTEDALLGIKCFTTKIKGVSTFVHGKESKSLVLIFENPEPIKKIHQSLAIGFSYKTPSFNPHITIAKQIPIASFEQIHTLADFDYQDDLICKKITLLKKVNYDDKASSYTKVQEFNLL